MNRLGGIAGSGAADLVTLIGSQDRPSVNMVP